jgi:hypothetical protein
MSRRALIALGGAGAVVAFLLITQAFGNGKSENDAATTTTSTGAPTEAVAWAGTVCSSFQGWQTVIKSETASLKADPSRAGLDTWLVEAEDATRALAATLRDAGVPSTAAGTEAKNQLHELHGKLQNDVSVLKRTLDSVSTGQGSIQSATSTVSAIFLTMKDELKSTGDALRSLPDGELEQAVASAPECKELNA